jgi:hypothetical protein
MVPYDTQQIIEQLDTLTTRAANAAYIRGQYDVVNKFLDEYKKLNAVHVAGHGHMVSAEAILDLLADALSRIPTSD